jgi:hypothetical protein
MLACNEQGPILSTILNSFPTSLGIGRVSTAPRAAADPNHARTGRK